MSTAMSAALRRAAGKINRMAAAGPITPAMLKQLIIDLPSGSVIMNPDCGLSKRDTAYYRGQAEKTYAREGEIELDEGAALSPSDEGSYVMAWVWVGKPEDAESEEGEDDEAED